MDNPPEDHPSAIGVPLLWHLQGPPSPSYRYELEDARGADVVAEVEPEKHYARPRTGGSRRRILKHKPGRIYCPIVADTEFMTVPPKTAGWIHESVLGVCQKIGRGSIPISIQLKGIHEEAPADVYLHPTYRKAFPRSAPEGLLQAKEPIVDYIARQLGARVRLEWKGSLEDEDYQAIAKRRTFRLHLFAHFAIAELARVWGASEITEHILSLCRKDGDRKEPWIVQGRRLRCEREIIPGGPPSEWLPLPAVIVIDGRKFALEFSVFDNSAMLGNAGRSLKGFHACAGVPMEAKDNYSRENKELMLLQFVSACDREGLARGAYRKFLPTGYNLDEDPLVAEGGPSTFLDYARGDVLTLYGAIQGVAEQFRRVYRSIGLEPYYRDPRPTTGSTVHDLIRASVFRLFEGVFADEEILLTKTDAKLVDRAIAIGTGSAHHGFDYLTPKQQAAFPKWFLGTEESVPRKFRKLIEELGFQPAEAKRIATADNWSGLNAKVFGGRCVNSAPTLIAARGLPIADVDLAGCYVAAMYQQEFPIGRPVIIGRAYGRGSKRNRYMSLGEFLAEYRDELVPSLWQAWISVEDEKGKPLPLPVDQDYFPSWQAPISFFEHDEDDEGLWLERTDQVRHYLREITNTVFTHDTLQWLEKVASKSFRDFVLKNGKVKTAMFYPRSSRVGSAKEFVRDYCAFLERNEEGNTSRAQIKKGATKTIDETCEFDGWFSIRLSDLIADSLKKKRDEFKVITGAYKAIKSSTVRPKNEAEVDLMEKGNAEKVKKVLQAGYPGGLAALVEEAGELAKHPLDELFKLCGNTVYGVVVSRFFQMSNPVVGNNVTARCRSVIALYQSACLGWNAITDGGLMRLDRVLYSRKKEDRWRLTEKASMLVEATNTELNAAQLKAAPIGGYKSIRWEGDELVFKKDGLTERFHKSEARGGKGNEGYLDKIDRLILEHVRGSFPEGIDVLAPDSPFTFETKGVVRDAAIHGAGNYYLRGGNHEGYPKDGEARMVKMRSYSSKIHESTLIPFFEQLLADPSKVDRSLHDEPFITSKILKTGAYNEQFESYYRDTILEPGDTVYEARFFRELGLSGFRFLNHAQEQAWTGNHNSLRQVSRDGSSYGQSLEGYFLDSEGWLDYGGMCVQINKAIMRGKKRFRDTDPPQHPKTVALQTLRRAIRKMFLKKDLTPTLEPYRDEFDERYDTEPDLGYISQLDRLYYEEIPDEMWF